MEKQTADVILWSSAANITVMVTRRGCSFRAKFLECLHAECFKVFHNCWSTAVSVLRILSGITKAEVTKQSG